MFDFKYAEYIVPAFAITAVVFAGLIWFSVGHARRWKKRFEELTAKGPEGK
jgi:heme exporter protein CcmD